MYTTILVIEQEFLIRRLLMKVLLRSGYRAWGVTNCTEALALLQKQAVDLILSDGRGFDSEADAHCRAMRQAVQAPILVLAASNRKSDLQRCLAWGADDCLPKPFTLAEVRGRVHGLLNGQCDGKALAAQ